MLLTSKLDHGSLECKNTLDNSTMSLINVTCTCLLFSYTFERVQENSEKLWRFQRYTVINDYDWRIPSPINLLFLPYRICCCPNRDHCCLDWCKGMLFYTIHTMHFLSSQTHSHIESFYCQNLARKQYLFYFLFIFIF